MWTIGNQQLQALSAVGIGSLTPLSLRVHRDAAGRGSVGKIRRKVDAASRAGLFQLGSISGSCPAGKKPGLGPVSASWAQQHFRGLARFARLPGWRQRQDNRTSGSVRIFRRHSSCTQPRAIARRQCAPDSLFSAYKEPAARDRVAEEFEEDAHGLWVPGIGFELAPRGVDGGEMDSASRIAQSKMLRHVPDRHGEQPAGHSMVKTGPVGGGCPRSEACRRGTGIATVRRICLCPLFWGLRFWVYLPCCRFLWSKRSLRVAFAQGRTRWSSGLTVGKQRAIENVNATVMCALPVSKGRK